MAGKGRPGSIWRSLVSPEQVVRLGSDGKEKQREIGGIATGCEACDLNVMPNLHKFIHTSDTAAKAMLWLPMPTQHETRLKRPFNSNLAAALTKYMAQWGVTREHFEVRYAVKCSPCVNTSKGVYFREQPQERHYIHCLPHSENLADMNTRARKGQPSTWLVFGIDTAKQVCGSEYKMDSPVFWSDRYKAKVFVLDLPRPELLEGTGSAAEAYRERLDAALWCVLNPGRYAFLYSLDVRPIYSVQEFKRLVADIHASGETVAIDIEDDGQGRLLCVGFCYTPEFATVLVLQHPENKHYDGRLVDALKAFLADPRIDKVFQFGSYDAIEFEGRGWPVAKYLYDTFYGSYLSASYQRRHGLEAIAQRNFPAFADYKSITSEYYEKDESGEDGAADRGAVGLARCPLSKLVPYNGGDVILTKLEERRTRNRIHPELMRCYIGAGKTLHKMEVNGPYVDMTHQAIVERVATKRLAQVEERLRRITNNQNFNPASPQQVLYYMHDVFHLPKLGDFDADFASEDGEEDEGTTEANALTRIYQETNHEFPKLILERREFDSYKTRYAGAYKASASHWGGQARTKFHLAGAASGRLRSGGGKRKKGQLPKFVNLQNITRTPFIKNLLCSDPNWRRVLEWARPAFQWARVTAPPIGEWNGKSFNTHDEWYDWKKSSRDYMLDMLGTIPEAILNLVIFCTFDLSQAELRVLALFSRDPELIAMFNTGLDVHCLVGEALGLGTYAEIKDKKNKELRTNIKALNFGLVYGLEAEGLYWYMKGLGATSTREEVAEMRARYFNRFRGVAVLIEQRHEEWRRQGYIDTPYFFRRWMGPKYEPGRKTNWDNISMNSPIQGTAHMLMIIALHILSIQPKKYAPLRGISMEVHDALITKALVRELPVVYPMMGNLLEVQTVKYTKEFFGYDIDVPIIAEGGVGFRYGVELETPNFDAGLVGVLLDWLFKNLETEAALSGEFGYDAPPWY